MVEDENLLSSPSLMPFSSFTKNRMLGYVNPSDSSALESLMFSGSYASTFSSLHHQSEDAFKSVSSIGLPTRYHITTYLLHFTVTEMISEFIVQCCPETTITMKTMRKNREVQLLTSFKLLYSLFSFTASMVPRQKYSWSKFTEKTCKWFKRKRNTKVS